MCKHSWAQPFPCRAEQVAEPDIEKIAEIQDAGAAIDSQERKI
jgi:hypothetical protein